MNVKLYRHNESGEVVAIAKVGLFANVLHDDGKLSTHICKTVTDKYTPLPDAPEVGSTAWAVWMMQKGGKVTRPEFTHSNYWFLDGDKITTDNGGHCSIQSIHNDWQLYAPPKPIVECLPHEFVEGQEVLVRTDSSTLWTRRVFHNFKPISRFYRECFRVKDGQSSTEGWDSCIPYAGNEHLEGTVTDGEHGAVPRGYVPPHLPQLGDDDYWCVGDAIRNVATMTLYKVMDVNLKTGVMTCEDTLLNRFHFNLDGRLCEKGIRVLYHYDENFIITGKVEDNPPTRPPKIIDTDTDGA